MNPQKKYFFSFFGMNGENNVVEIWQDTANTIVAEEIQGMDNPFSVEMPSLDSKGQPVRGTGCKVSVNCKSNMKFFNGLYHVNPKEFIIKHYINGVLNWIGYMNSELFNETYSELSDYTVDFTGNDGFSLMDRFHFIQDDKSKYTGIKSQWEIIKIIFTKIGLPLNDINVCLSTTFTGMVGTETIFHETFLDCANFYNEDGEPETLRVVLEAMLLPYYAFIVQFGGDIYITDVHNIASLSDFNFKRYSASTWLYLGLESTVNNARELSSIGFAGTGHNIEVSGGMNKQVVSYSPYPYSTALSNSISDIGEFDFRELSWNARYDIFYDKIITNKYWTGSNFEITRYGFDEIKSYANQGAFPMPGQSGKTYKAIDTQYEYRWNDYSYVKIAAGISFGTPENMHLRIPYTPVNTLMNRYVSPNIFTLPKGQYVGVNDLRVVKGSGLMLTGNIGAIVTDYTYNGGTVTYGVNNLYIKSKLKIGNYYFNGVDWKTSEVFWTIRISKPDGLSWGTKLKLNGNIDKSINNDLTMITLGNRGAIGIFIPVTTDLSGNIEFEIYSDVMTDITLMNGTVAYLDNSNASTYQGFKEYWLNDISLNIVRDDGSKLSTSDMEYIGYLDENFKDEAPTIKLLCGTESSVSDRGKMLYYDTVYKPITQWQRGPQIAPFKIEELLLGSLSSNDRAGYYTISGLVLNNTLKPYNVITDNAFLAGRKFMVKSYSINYQDSIISCDLMEISPDTLIIKP